RAALQPRLDTHYADYSPASRSVPRRHSFWSANLLLLTVLSTGEVSTSELFPAADDPARTWFDTAQLWRSQLHPGWTALTHSLQAHRTWDGERRDLRICLADDQPLPQVDAYWTSYGWTSYGYGPVGDIRATAAMASLADRPGGGWIHWDYDDIHRKQDFV